MTSTQLPQRVRVVEVGPRDGLQNEQALVATEDKIRFVELLADAGLRDIEVSSFVSPRRVPQLADADAVFAGLSPRPDVRYSALVPNAQGLGRALAAGVRAIALFTAASETFTQKNIGKTIAASLAEFRALLPAARAQGVWVRAYVSCAYACPYEGAITPGQVVPVVGELEALGVDEIAIGDTIGQATPDDVARLAQALASILPPERIAYHFHDTRGNALANVQAALQSGATIFDAAAGGIGGCPFAPGAPGNLATEDLLVLLHDLNIETGVDTHKIASASRFLETKLGRALRR